MERTISPLQLSHILIEGISFTVCVELVIRCVFVPPGQKSWLIRILKIIMAATMCIKNAIFASFSSDALGQNCWLLVRAAVALFHISSLAGLCILLLRVKTILPNKYQKVSTIFHCAVMVLRCALGVVDVILANIWVHPISGVCRYRDNYVGGVAYVMMDTVVDTYVSVVITIVLVSHIKKIHELGVGGNENLYVSVVMNNVIRTTILSILNFTYTVYFLAANKNIVTVMILWPVHNIFFVALIGYDTNIAKTLAKLQLLRVNASMAISKRPSHHLNTDERRIPLTTSLSEPVTIANQNSSNRSKFVTQQRDHSHQPSGFLISSEKDRISDNALSKVPETPTEESERSAGTIILDMVTQDNMTNTNNHMLCRSQTQ